MEVEICANSFESALAAQEGGAHRVELCEHLGVGGLTPSESLLEQVLTTLSIPVHVLIRPRAGNFVYSEDERMTVLNTIERCKEQHCAGIVVGALTSKNEVDVAFLKQIVAVSEGMHLTFHRAFDYVIQPLKTLETLLEMGMHRLLSSGQCANAMEGLPLLLQLLEQSDNSMDIMPGAGIRPSHIAPLKHHGFKHVHLSAIRKSDPPPTAHFFDTGV